MKLKWFYLSLAVLATLMGELMCACEQLPPELQDPPTTTQM